MRNSVRHKRSADSLVDALFPVDEIDSTRHLYPQVVLSMQENVEVRKGGRIQRGRPTAAPPKVSIYGRRAEDVLRTANRGTIRIAPSTRRER